MTMTNPDMQHTDGETTEDDGSVTRTKKSVVMTGGETERNSDTRSCTLMQDSQDQTNMRTSDLSKQAF